MGLVVVAGAPAIGDDGDLDLTFGLFGRATLGNGLGGPILARGDGSLRVAIGASYDVGVLALEESGSLDSNFGVNGVRMVTIVPGGNNYDDPVALFERPNGKLLMVVDAQDDGEQVPVLVQFTADGDLDTGFGTDGVKILFPPGAWTTTRVYAAALQTDGKVVLAGICNDCTATGSFDSFVARLDEAGLVDPDFGTNGWTPFDADEVGDNPDYAQAVAIDAAGRIVVGGVTDYTTTPLPYVARRLANGSPDSSFAGSNGIQTILDLPGEGVTAVAIAPESGRVCVATGDGSSQFPDTAGVACLTSSGALDGSFSGDGIADLTLEEGTYLERILIQSDEKVVAAGSIDANGTEVGGFLFARFATNGALDPTFDGNGLKRIEFNVDPEARDWLRGATLVGGRIVAAGAATDGAGTVNALVRLQSALIFTDGFERGTTAGWLGN